MPRFQEFESPTAFLKAVGTTLEADECLHCVAIDVVQRTLLRESNGEWPTGSKEPDRDFLGAIWRDDGQLDAPVWRTAPYPIGISGGSEEGVAHLVQALHGVGIAIRGAICSPQNAAAIAREVSAIDGRETEIMVAQRLFRLDEVIAPRATPGAMVPATRADAALAHQWAHRFSAEAGLAPASARLADIANPLDRGELWFWIVDGEPVAMAGCMRQSPKGASISWVFTPRAHRRNGYASSLVAALSQHFLDRGKDFCCLFTDLDNPTSNRTYQALGYRPVADLQRVQFHSLRSGGEGGGRGTD